MKCCWNAKSSELGSQIYRIGICVRNLVMTLVLIIPRLIKSQTSSLHVVMRTCDLFIKSLNLRGVPQPATLLKKRL